jgi:hypothetical protein
LDVFASVNFLKNVFFYEKFLEKIFLKKICECVLENIHYLPSTKFVLSK